MGAVMMVSDKDLGWLAGLFDGEGCITYGSRRKYIQLKLEIGSSDRTLLEKAQTILDELEIDSSLYSRSPSKYRTKTFFDLDVRCKRNIERFFAKIPVQGEEKLARWSELRILDTSHSMNNTKAERQRLQRVGQSIFG